ncbi:serine/threonine-protein kinase Nek6-like [Diaphorina citri]|uniref:non-specific serine/threonine protein kinase n=1 Tax=Diaphorina citri TaxID=121845 RepID=A0A3Q0ITJ9_DIACI|nr:serine/threonine-protein kinase Nek6-like [Diaphorina citri]
MLFEIDIKPSNIFLSAHNRIKLGDLGFSRSMSVKTSSVDSFLGTPYYMSPERLKELKYSFPSDVWSLGCVLYEMVALQSPFFSKHISLNGLCKRIEMALFPPLPSGVLYSDKVGKIIESCLIPNPDLRPNIDALVQMSST